jgi:hypothetical protein
MKHILNNLSNEEKNSIREQHTGGMKVMTENFSKLMNSKLGDSKPLVSEQPKTTKDPITGLIREKVMDITTLGHDLKFDVNKNIKFFYDDVTKSFEVVDVDNKIRYKGNLK